ncbi:long-chain-fatty-acid-- ligase 1-like [Paramuricea clavata]|uniref:long-chain-fatty-acid--CoA ligase n=1 Tax=Paramuricea clavata TaxID=317549 RepID=A0A7D9F003_PARCT|nr:long-chain-fatty-acid-- ligase 1-like [Paramuricea clavata]
MVFKKFQAILGGSISVIGTGAAPIEAKVLTFLRVVLGCWIREGYGQTECTCPGTLTNKFDTSSGTCINLTGEKNPIPIWREPIRSGKFGFSVSQCLECMELPNNEAILDVLVDDGNISIIYFKHKLGHSEKGQHFSHNLCRKLVMSV